MKDEKWKMNYKNNEKQNYEQKIKSEKLKMMNGK